MALPIGIAFDLDPLVAPTAPDEYTASGSKGIIMRATNGDAAGVNLLTNPIPYFDEGWAVAAGLTRKNHAKYPTPQSLSSAMTGWTGVAGTSGSGTAKVVEVPVAYEMPARFAFAWQWNVASPLNGAGGVATTLGNIVDLVPGKSMRFTVIPYILMPTTGGRQQLTMNIQWINAAGSVLSTSAGTSTTIFSQVAFSRVATVPTNATQAIVQIYRATGGSQAAWASGTVFGIANLMVEEEYAGPARPWFCGATPGAQWDGPEYASTSTFVIPAATATQRTQLNYGGRRGDDYGRMEYVSTVTGSRVVAVVENVGVFTTSSAYEVSRQLVHVYTEHSGLKAIAYGRSHFGPTNEASAFVDLIPGEWTPVSRGITSGNLGADKKELLDFKVMILSDTPVTGDFTFAMCDARLQWYYGILEDDYKDGSFPGYGWQGESFHSRSIGKFAIIDDPDAMEQAGIGRPAFFGAGGATAGSDNMGGVPPATVAVVMTPVTGHTSYTGYPAANNQLSARAKGGPGTPEGEEFQFAVTSAATMPDDATEFPAGKPVVLVAVTEASRQRAFVNGVLSHETTANIQDYGPVSPVYLSPQGYFHRFIAWDRALNEGELEQVFADLSAYLKSEVNIAWDPPADWGGGDAVGYVIRSWDGGETSPVVEVEVPWTDPTETTIEVTGDAVIEISAVSSLGRSTPVAVQR